MTASDFITLLLLIINLFLFVFLVVSFFNDPEGKRKRGSERERDLSRLSRIAKFFFVLLLLDLFSYLIFKVRVVAFFLSGGRMTIYSLLALGSLCLFVPYLFGYRRIYTVRISLTPEQKQVLEESQWFQLDEEQRKSFKKGRRKTFPEKGVRVIPVPDKANRWEVLLGSQKNLVKLEGDNVVCIYRKPSSRGKET